MPQRRRPPSQGSLSSEDLRLARQVDELYGPPRWTWDEWAGAARPSASQGPSVVASQRRIPAAAVVLRTVVLLALAGTALYVVGDRAGAERALTESLQAAGILRATPVPTPAPEYALALRTLRIGDAVPPSEQTVRDLKALLDQMAPKCRQDRSDLAKAVAQAHDQLASRGIDRSAVWILTQADSSLPSSTRQEWPTDCSVTLDRVVSSAR